MFPLGYGVKRALSPKEYLNSSRAGNFNGGALSLHCAHRWKEVIAVDLVVAQMLVTGVLLFAFSVEVLIGKLIRE